MASPQTLSAALTEQRDLQVFPEAVPH